MPRWCHQKKQGLTPLEYMKRHGAFLVEDQVYEGHGKEVKVDGVPDEGDAVLRKDGKVVAPIVQGKARAGFPTRSKRLELHNLLLEEWGWGEHAFAHYTESHVDEKHPDRSKGECVLVSTFRLPTLIHTRSANSKWLTELSNTNPVWIHPSDAQRLGVATGDLVRVTTRIGYYVNKAWVTEGVRPGLVACSHHLGRFRRKGEAQGVNRWQQHESDMQEVAPGKYLIRRTMSVQTFDSADPDSKRVWRREGGVHQNFTFPVQPDPVSGMHCWHQKVTVTKAQPGDAYGDTFVDTNESMKVYREWVAKARPAPGPGGFAPAAGAEARGAAGGWRVPVAVAGGEARGGWVSVRTAWPRVAAVTGCGPPRNARPSLGRASRPVELISLLAILGLMTFAANVFHWRCSRGSRLFPTPRGAWLRSAVDVLRIGTLALAVMTLVGLLDGVWFGVVLMGSLIFDNASAIGARHRRAPGDAAV
jgi:hypothetical protein